MADKITKEEWQIDQSKPEKKKFSTQKSGTLDDEVSDREDSEHLSSAEDIEVSRSGDHVLGWSGAHFRPKGNMSSFNDHESKANSAGIHNIEK